MIFWLCFLFCIQSNASPFSRLKHQVQDWHLHRMEPGHRNEFQQIHPKHYATNVRSINEKFPWMKTKFKNRATRQNSNTITNPPSLNQTQNVTQEPYVKKADRFSDKITKLAVPKTKAYGSRKKHNLLHWNYRHQPTKENISRNDKLEPIASPNSQVKRKISNNANQSVSSNFEQEVNQNPDRADDILKRSHSNETDRNKQFGSDDGQKIEKASPNVGPVNRGVRFGAHNPHRQRKKTKHQKHISAGSGLNSQERKHIAPISQPTEAPANGQSLNEIPKPGSGLNSQERKHIAPDSQPTEAPANGQSLNEIPKPSLGEDIQTVQRFSGAPLDEETNSSQINKTSEQNDNNNDQQNPIKKDEPNISESNENVNEPLDERSNQIESSKVQYPLNSKRLINENDAQRDGQMDESFIAQNPEYTDQPLDYDFSDYNETTQEGQEDGSSTEESAKESTDLYQPIHFKLRDGSELISRSMFNSNKTESPKITKQVESKDVRDDQEHYFDENEINNFGNGSEFYPLSNEILTTYSETEYSVTPFTVTPLITDLGSTAHILKKKSSSLENLNKEPLGSNANVNKTSRMRKSYFAHKRSHQHPSSSNGISSMARRNNDINAFDSNSDIHKNKFNGYNMETHVPKYVNFKNIQKKYLHNKRDEAETSTSIISEYVFPTLGLPNKILKTALESKKRSSPHKNNQNNDTFHANVKRFQNRPSNKMDQTETKIWKKPTLESKINRNVNESISSTQYPLQVNGTDVPDKVLRHASNQVEFSKRNNARKDVVDKVTRTKEKTTQTIVTDGQSDKKTNIIEEKVVDRIQVQKQPSASSKGIENQGNNDASEQLSEENDYYPNEYENSEYSDVSPESDIGGPMYSETTEDMGIDNDSSNGAMDTSIKKIPNALKTDEFKNPPPNSKSDYRDTTSKTDFQNNLKSNAKPVSPPAQPRPNNAQGSNNANSLVDKEIAKEFENLEPPNEDEYSNQESADESQPGGQQSSFNEYDNVNGPEQSTNDFIDLADQDGKKETVLEDLDKFPTSKQSNRPNLGYEYRGQKGNFYEFSTVLPVLKDMGEFHREEKVERQSKIIHKNHGIMTNGSSSLFGEKKIEVKDNKQNFHETFMEERGESKFPSEPEDTELQKRDDQNSNFSNPSDQGEIDYENPTSTKNKKNVNFARDSSNDEYYYEEEDDSDSTADSDDPNEKEYDDDYLVEPADVLQNEGRIDGIIKRSGAFTDIDKLKNNSEALESTVTPDNVSQSNKFTKKEIPGNEVIATKLFDDESDKIGEHTIRTAKQNSNASTNDQMKPSSNIEQNILESQITNRQIEPEITPSNQTEVGSTENHDLNLMEAMENKRDDVPLNVSTSGSSGSGNIVYVTISSTTDKDSQFNDFLNIEDKRRESRQLPRHQDDAYHRQKKHSQKHKTSRFLPNYRINRNSKHH